MAHAGALGGKPAPVFEDGVAAAWRRLWRRREGGADAAEYWTSGVTYRGYLGANGDVSALWITEQQLKETQALLRIAAAAGRLGAWGVELTGQNWVWSDEVKAIHEVPPGYQPTTEDALAFYKPESQEPALEAFEACARDGTPFDLELQLVTARGRDVWIRVTGEADRNAEGQITHVRGAIQDVSRFRAVADEARRTAERFTKTLESLTDGLILLDHEWCFVYLNPEAERILRRTQAELLGRCLLVEFPETAAGKFLERCQNAIRDGHSVEFEKFYPPLSIWMHMKVTPSDLGITVSIHDDTERITAQREILALKAQLQSLKAKAAAAG
jgi:PAS domain S-box-containing protein